MERMTKEEFKKELEKLKDFKLYTFEGDIYVKAEDYKNKAIENKKLKEECEENDYLVEDNARWMKKCEEKTMEIKKLKSDLAFERTMLDNVRAEYKSLQNVKEKLNIKVASLEGEIKGLNYTIDKLKEENQTLELWLDNKEKLNEEYRKQIDKYKKQYQHSMGEDDELIYEEGLYD